MVKLAKSLLSFFFFINCLYATADTQVQPKEDNTETVMYLMRNIEDNNIQKSNVDNFLKDFNVSDETKEQVKNLVNQGISYSSHDRLGEGSYILNKSTFVDPFSRGGIKIPAMNYVCKSFGLLTSGCQYNVGSLCTQMDNFNCM